MERTFTASTRLALALLGALLAFNAYRAAARDVTPAEAWNYDRYIGPSWQESLGHYDVNNHFLNTFLARISTRKLRLTEFSLRLPALLAGLFYCWAAWRICRRLFGGSWMFPAAIGVMTLNPLIADALSEARGYGMAMAFWLGALELMLQSSEEFSARKLNLAAGCLALSAASCLTFIVPALGLIAAFSRAARKPLARDLYLPFLVFLFVLLVLPLNRVLLSDFATGSKSLWHTLVSLSGHSFGDLPGIAEILVVVTCVSALFALLRSTGDPFLAMTSGTAAMSAAILVLAHALIKAPFPQQGGIYFILLITLSLLGLAGRYSGAALSMAIACCLIYAVRFPAGAYLEGKDAAGGREIAKALRAAVGSRHVRVAAAEDLEPVVNYYRSQYGQANWERVERKAPGTGFDYYILHDDASAARLGLRVVHSAGNIVLAAPGL